MEMEMFIGDNLKTVKKMEKEFILLQMELYTMVILIMMFLKVMEKLNILMVINIKVILPME